MLLIFAQKRGPAVGLQKVGEHLERMRGTCPNTSWKNVRLGQIVHDLARADQVQVVGNSRWANGQKGLGPADIRTPTTLVGLLSQNLLMPSSCVPPFFTSRRRFDIRIGVSGRPAAGSDRA